MSKQELIAEIHKKIAAKRLKRGITPTPGPREELSGEAFGEHHILAKSLLWTTEGTGAWVDPPLEELEIDFLLEVLQAIDEE